jgi:hypothetical protein
LAVRRGRVEGVAMAVAQALVDIGLKVWHAGVVFVVGGCTGVHVDDFVHRSGSSTAMGVDVDAAGIVKMRGKNVVKSGTHRQEIS